MVIPVGRVSELQQHGPELVNICQSLCNDIEEEKYAECVTLFRILLCLLGLLDGAPSFSVLSHS